MMNQMLLFTTTKQEDAHIHTGKVIFVLFIFVFTIFDRFKAVTRFLDNNDLLCVIRAHEAQDLG